MIKVIKQITILSFSLFFELFNFFIFIFVNFFFFFFFFLVTFFLYALNSFIYCIFFLYIYLYLISPIIYLLLYLTTYFSKFLPFLFIYFLMCYNTIYLPGYKVFYFFGYSLYYWRWYYNYYIKYYLLKHNYIYLLHFFFLFFLFFNIFGEFNLLSFIFYIYFSFLIYYYIFLFFKFIGNIFSLFFLLIINFIYINKIIIISLFNEESIDTTITPSETLWEMFNYRLNYRISSKAYRNKKNLKLNELLFDFIKNRESDQLITLEENYYDWFKLRFNLLNFFNFNDYRSYWVQNQKLLKSLENEYNTIDEIKEFLEEIDDLEILSIRPIKDYYYRNFDLDDKLMDFSQESYFIYKNILKDEMGTDIYYLPTAKERRGLSYILGNRIYRYNIKDDFLKNEIEENYREIEINNLDKEYLIETEDIKFNFFNDLKTLIFNIEDYYLLYDLKSINYNELYYNKNLKNNLNYFFTNYLNNKNLYNDGTFYAYNEHFIYQNYKELDDDILNEFYEPFCNFERDLNKRENYNFNRLYKAISETALCSTEEVSSQEYDFTEIKRYQDEENQQIFYNKGEHQIEKQKFINAEMLEENEDLLALEATRIKFNKVKSKHLYRFYKDNKISYMISDHDKKVLLKADDFYY